MKKTKEIQKYLDYQRKIMVLEYARDIGSNRNAYETFGISKTTFFHWKKRYESNGKDGLLRKERDPDTYANRINSRTIELILKIREEHQLATHGGLNGIWRGIMG